jgi:hypothetical protein
MNPERDRQIAKEIMVALIQAGGQASHPALFSKEKHAPDRTEAFEAVWARILKTISENNQ